MLGDTPAVARDLHGRSFWTSAGAAVETLYHDCAPAAARLAAARLRPQARTPYDQPCPLSASRTCRPAHRAARRPHGPTAMVSCRRPTAARRRADRAARRALPMLADPERLRTPSLHSRVTCTEGEGLELSERVVRVYGSLLHDAEGDPLRLRRVPGGVGRDQRGAVAARREAPAGDAAREPLAVAAGVRPWANAPMRA